MQSINTENITIDELSLPLLSEKNVSLSVLRLDKIHPEISGNKWFKLQYYLEDAIKQNKKTVLTFGGAWSNHILATAAICKLNKLNSIGIIRGEEAEKLSDTLQKAKQIGMRLVFIDRIQYKHKIIPAELNFSDYYAIPEGGYGVKGAAGAATMLNYCSIDHYSHICCAAGTGTMAAGLLTKITGGQQVIAVSVLKNYLAMEEKIKEITTLNIDKLKIFHDYHCGGYAKMPPYLLAFMNDFYLQTKIPTDFVYTGKLCFATLDLIEKDHFEKGSNVLLIHSGGLQGNDSLSNRTLIF